ncbi:MAG: NUDIX hydrolase [Actinomycetota bacterium]
MTHAGRSLPQDLIDRARTASTTAPVPARDSATVVVLRDAPDHGIEAYVLRRLASMSFAPGMYVFPGGSVDPGDAVADIPWAGPPPSQWAALLSADEPLTRALVCAAVRETFEECGVLLAGPDASATACVDADWAADRAQLQSGAVSLPELLVRRQLVLRADLLRPWAHWVTPEFEPKRFDTRFFVAALPEGQVPAHFRGESDRGAWVRPADALTLQAEQQIAMLPPTAFTLAELAEFASVADVLAAAAGRQFRRNLPKVIVTGDDVRLLLPGDDGYPDDGDTGG